MNPQEPSTVYIMAKRKFKVYPNIVESSKNTRRFSAILYTGAGCSFICFNELPIPLRNLSKRVDGPVTIPNASGKTVTIARTIERAVQIGTSQAMGTFLVAKLATKVILRCDVCD